jgi:predicted small lipoprotein YifL
MRQIIRSAAALAVLASLAGCVGAPGPAPVAYQPAPPVYSQGAPPAYTQGGAVPQQVAYGATCFAGVYTCPLPQSLPIGAPCTCPGLGAPSYGNVR